MGPVQGAAAAVVAAVAGGPQAQVGGRAAGRGSRAACGVAGSAGSVRWAACCGARGTIHSQHCCCAYLVCCSPEGPCPRAPPHAPRRQEQYLAERARRDAERAARMAELAGEPFDKEVTMCEQVLNYLAKFVANEAAVSEEKKVTCRAGGWVGGVGVLRGAQWKARAWVEDWLLAFVDWCRACAHAREVGGAWRSSACRDLRCAAHRVRPPPTRRPMWRTWRASRSCRRRRRRTRTHGSWAWARRRARAARARAARRVRGLGMCGRAACWARCGML